MSLTDPPVGTTSSAPKDAAANVPTNIHSPVSDGEAHRGNGDRRGVEGHPRTLRRSDVDPARPAAQGDVPGLGNHDGLTDQEWRDHLEQLGVEDLRRLAATLPVIEQAKGVLMAYYSCNATAAFNLLRRWSSARNVKLRTLAHGVITAAGQPSPMPFGALHRFIETTNQP